MKVTELLYPKNYCILNLKRKHISLKSTDKSFIFFTQLQYWFVSVLIITSSKYIHQCDSQPKVHLQILNYNIHDKYYIITYYTDMDLYFGARGLRVLIVV